MGDTIGENPSDKGQCVGEIEMWNIFRGAPLISAQYARQLYANADPNVWEKIPYPMIPKRGDIFVMNAWGSNYAGHTGVVTNADANTLYSFDQNWSQPNKCSDERHAYSNIIIGYLRWKEDMITDTDNEYARWNKLFQQIRVPRQTARSEFQGNAVGLTWLKAMEILSDDADADKAYQYKIAGMTCGQNADYEALKTTLKKAVV